MTVGDGGRGQYAVISGGSSGIGLAAARLLMRKGCHVALLGRDERRLADAAQSLAGEGRRVETRSVDVRDGARCDAVMGDLATRFGAPLWAVASAGIVEPGFFLEQDPALVEDQVATNLLGTIRFVRAVAPAMVAARRGHIVLVSSGAGLVGVAGYSAYCATKFAVRGLGEALRVELGAQGVGVTVAVPPDTNTPQLAYEMTRRPRAIAAFAAGGPPLSAERVAAHMIRTAERGGFLSAPTWKLRAIAELGAAATRRLMAVQERLLRAGAEPQAGGTGSPAGEGG